ncbi:unnamed protein product [Euphydryas editha]|uniref:RNase H type-1 domain-containing protein n=1 Tax=Euphydryas editha TaxID=104508 RepID=A0AAU9TIV0_EUPED|nr:unnamed protein product [Euphydryas editha]
MVVTRKLKYDIPRLHMGGGIPYYLLELGTVVRWHAPSRPACTRSRGTLYCEEEVPQWVLAAETKTLKLALTSYCTIYQAELLAMCQAARMAADHLSGF